MKEEKRHILKYLNNNLKGDFSTDELLSKHTWYKIGGPADFIVYPKDIEALISLVSFCRVVDVPINFIGEGANLLVCDAGFRGVIIKLSRHFNSIEMKNNTVNVDAGVLLPDLVLYCEKNSLGGVEYLSGIPGTLGGALIMNAGTSKGDISNSVQEVSTLDNQLNLEIINKNEIDFQYRFVPQFHERILLGCKLQLRYAEKSYLKEIRIDQIQERANKQPIDYPSCGSVFKRPAKYYVGKLVEDAGLKGFRHGGAMISNKHAGFIINSDNAKAKDVMYIIRKVQEEVYKSFNVELEPEVKFLGFDP
ncbi:MAG: UDP-N-acetylmuramate dehydrogenase [Candidatus Omnitrophica bacterium]|nr:UDP-N-acetylmuramate dehydrogenase [Candidatus Omnitrophota bacterium]